MKTVSEWVAQSDPLLVNAANAATTVIAATPANYAMNSTNATLLATRATAFSGAFDALEEAKAAYDAAIKAKQIARESFTTLFTDLLTASVATPSVTEPNLALIGLLKRTPRSVRPLRQPLSFAITPTATGLLECKWKRNQNTNATVFVIQQIIDGEWEQMWSGTRIRAVLAGYPQGVPATFRVIATKSDEESEPSLTVTVYGAGGEGALRVAA